MYYETNPDENTSRKTTACTTINYSDIFLSCFTDNAQKYAPMIKDHGLAYVLGGELEINENDKITRLHKGECAFIRRDNRISVNKLPKNGEQFKSIWLSFTRDFLREFFETLGKKRFSNSAKRHKTSLQKLPANRPDVKSLFESIIPYFNSGMQPAPELIKLKMTEGIHCLLNTDKNFCTALFDFSEPWKIDLLDFMNENYMQDLSIQEIALFTARSLATFKRDFKKISDLTPKKWVMKKRLEVAYQKIQEGEKIVDIYFELGFKSLSHFSTAFRKQYGFAPTQT